MGVTDLDVDLGDVLSSQRSSGAFPSTVVGRGLVLADDENAFVTVQCLRALDVFHARPVLEARSRALEFLERCRHRSGGYGFWPEERWPPWAAHFGPDTDDTSLIADTLLTAGRLDAGDVLDTIATLSKARRRTTHDMTPPWIGAGAFATWVERPITVDVVVNANIAGFLASAGHRGRFGYDAAVRTVCSAIDWASDSWPRLVSIAPFYPHPAELRVAIVAALARGAIELRGALAALDQRFGSRLDGDVDTPVCGSAYGAVRWYAPVLVHARRIRSVAGTPGA